jgi:hypothetical protein
MQAKHLLTFNKGIFMPLKFFIPPGISGKKPVIEQPGV